MKNLENESAKWNIFDVFLEAFLLRIICKLGFPQKSK